MNKIIYPLPARELDDKTLDKQTENIAQTLCNVHYATLHIIPSNKHADIPLPAKYQEKLFKYVNWASKFKANYLKLVEMGMAYCSEYLYRFSDIRCPSCNNEHLDTFFNIAKPNMRCEYCSQFVGSVELGRHKNESVIKWAFENIPSLLKDKRCEVCDASLEPVGSWCSFCDNQGFIKIETPFPVCLPAKYIEYLSSTVRENCEKPLDIEQSYRNCYSYKIKKWIKKVNICNNCGGIATSCIINSGKYLTNAICLKCTLNLSKEPVMPTWTRREKPSWIIEG